MDMYLIKNVKSRGVLDLETIMNRKGFHPAMISHKKVRRNVHIIVTFLQIKHTTFGEVERHFGHRNVVPVRKIEIFQSFKFLKWFQFAWLLNARLITYFRKFVFRQSYQNTKSRFQDFHFHVFCFCILQGKIGKIKI